MEENDHHRRGKAQTCQWPQRLWALADGEAELLAFSDDPAAAEQTKFCAAAARSCSRRTGASLGRNHVTEKELVQLVGAWLNRAPEKVVVAPRAWFVPAD
jgi:hypothetical protein